jgi:polyvinyl alcohol dehydrogenase (cytochrome)
VKMYKLALFWLVLGVAAGHGTLASAADEQPSQDSQQMKRLSVFNGGGQTGRGAELFRSNCARCHESAVERAPPQAVLALMSPSSIVRALTEGAMRSQGNGLSAADKVLVAEYLTHQKFDAKQVAAGPPACAVGSAQFDLSEPPAFAGWGVTLHNLRRIPGELAGIDRHNVGTVRLKWAVGFPDAVRNRSEPALAGGALYVGSQGGTVYALDRATGCVRWTFQAAAEARSGMVVSGWKAGDSAARPLVFFGDLIGNLYAVDARAGKLVWRDHPDAHPLATITAAPTLYEGRLYVSLSSSEEAMIDPGYACCSFRGSVVAYDAQTGRRLWQTFTTDPPVQQGTASNGARRLGPSGASIWNSPTIDEKRRRLYVGTGDNYSAPATRTSDSVLALDLDGGKIAWVHQTAPGDIWNVSCALSEHSTCPPNSGPDYDIGAATILATASNGRDYLVAGQKSGAVFALDPDSGQLLWRKQVGRGGLLGGVQFGMAVSGDTVFVPMHDVEDGRHYVEPAHPGLYAVSLLSGEDRWQAPTTGQPCAKGACRASGIAGAITVAGDLVLAGSVDGQMRIYDSKDGRVLWHFDTAQRFSALNGGVATGGSISGGAGPIAYRGTLIVLSGYGVTGGVPGNALLMFETRGTQP